jgi:uncharacterized protein
VGQPDTVVVDAGAVYASVDRTARSHEACVALFTSLPGPFVIPTLAIAELTYLIGARLHVEAELRFLGDLAVGNFIVDPVHPADWLRIAELVARYRDLPLGTVDASIVAAAERLGVGRIATLDRRHFSVVRPLHADVFELMP